MQQVIRTLLIILAITVISVSIILIIFFSAAKGTDLNSFVQVTGKKYVIIATGSDYGMNELLYTGTGGTRFAHEGTNIATTLVNEYGYDSSTLSMHAENKKEFLAKLGELSGKLKAGDQLSIIFLAHGGKLKNEDNAAVMLDEPLYATEISEAVDEFNGVRLFIFISSCSSGEFVHHLSKVNRVIITSGVGNEMNTNLPSYAFAEGLSGKKSDINGDGKTSVAESFQYIKKRVAEEYARITGIIRPNSDLVQIDDNADGIGSVEDLPHGAEGYVAEITYF